MDRVKVCACASKWTVLRWFTICSLVFPLLRCYFLFLFKISAKLSFEKIKERKKEDSNPDRNIGVQIILKKGKNRNQKLEKWKSLLCRVSVVGRGEIRCCVGIKKLYFTVNCLGFQRRTRRRSSSSSSSSTSVTTSYPRAPNLSSLIRACLLRRPFLLWFIMVKLKKKFFTIKKFIL